MKKNKFIFLQILFLFLIPSLFADPWSLKMTNDTAVHGWLWYNGKLFPECFNSVTVNGVTYDFKISDNGPGDDGYFKSKKKLLMLESDQQITDAELESGFYSGSEVKKGTPASWVFVKWGTSTAIVDPEEIASLIDIYKIPKIARTTLKKTSPTPDATTTASP